MPKPQVITEEMRQAGRIARAEKKALRSKDAQIFKKEEHAYWLKQYDDYMKSNPYCFVPKLVFEEYSVNDPEDYRGISALFMKAAELTPISNSVYVGQNTRCGDYGDSLRYSEYPAGAYVLFVQRVPTEAEEEVQKEKYELFYNNTLNFYKKQIAIHE